MIASSLTARGWAGRSRWTRSARRNARIWGCSPARHERMAHGGEGAGTRAWPPGVEAREPSEQAGRMKQSDYRIIRSRDKFQIQTAAHLESAVLGHGPAELHAEGLLEVAVAVACVCVCVCVKEHKENVAQRQCMRCSKVCVCVCVCVWGGGLHALRSEVVARYKRTRSRRGRRMVWGGGMVCGGDGVCVGGGGLRKCIPYMHARCRTARTHGGLCVQDTCVAQVVQLRGGRATHGSWLTCDLVVADGHVRRVHHCAGEGHVRHGEGGSRSCGERSDRMTRGGGAWAMGFALTRPSPQSQPAVPPAPSPPPTAPAAAAPFSMKYTWPYGRSRKDQPGASTPGAPVPSSCGAGPGRAA